MVNVFFPVFVRRKEGEKYRQRTLWKTLPGSVDFRRYLPNRPVSLIPKLLCRVIIFHLNGPEFPKSFRSIIADAFTLVA